jgi:hypothetical protein
MITPEYRKLVLSPIKQPFKLASIISKYKNTGPSWITREGTVTDGSLFFSAQCSQFIFYTVNHLTNTMSVILTILIAEFLSTTGKRESLLIWEFPGV